MGIEYKSVAVGGVSEIKDEGDGVVVAYVSVTGVEDNVGDVIEPKSYQRTLSKRTPKGVWGHQWLTPTSKTLAADELPPGHKDLPKTLSDGQPWPEEAGALRIKMQFNLNTARGREAYSDVQFFGDQQEWSIGYVVPSGGAYKDEKGVRHITDLDLYEYSPVLFGANSHARTAVSVKDAQIGNKLMSGVPMLEIKSLEEQIALFRKEQNLPEIDEAAGEDFEADEASEDEVDYEAEEAEEGDDDEYEDDDDEEPEEDEAKSLADILSGSLTVKELRDAYTSIGRVLDALGEGEGGNVAAFLEFGTKALVEVKALAYNSITEAVDSIDVDIDATDAKDMRHAAMRLDDALSTKDSAAATDAAMDLLDVLEKVMDTTDDDDISLKVVARTVSDKTASKEEEEEEDDVEEDSEEDFEEESEEEPEDDEEDWRKYKKKSVTIAGVEYKNVNFAGREFGMPVGAGDMNAKTRQEVFVASMPLGGLMALDAVLAETRGNAGLKALVSEELDFREYSGELTEEVKMRMPSARGGQHGRGGGRHRQAVEGRTPGSGRNFGETGATTKPTAKRLKKAVKGVKRPGTSKKVVKTPSGSRTPLNPMRKSDPRDLEYKRDYSSSERRTAARKGNAMPDESFPINNATDLKNAIRLCGNSKNPEAAKAHIMKRAKAMGKESMIPDEWKTEQISTIELKGLQDFLEDL